MSTFSPSIVSMILNESLVTPGSRALSELSVNEKSQVTVAVFAPASLYTRTVDSRHVNDGGS